MRFLLSALLSWLVSAAVLLPAAALVLCKSNISSDCVGYISSALSLAAATFAGIAAAKRREEGKIYTALLTAATLITVLLTAGFLIKGSDMGSSGILSVITFTLSGCLIGAVFAPKGRRRAKRRLGGLHNFRK